MIAVKEITVWKEINVQPNHVYLMDGEKAVGYIKWGKGKSFYFKTPIRLDKRGRKFEELKKNPFKVVDTVVNPAIIKVQGSKGQTYSVNTEERSCSCPGYTFRGACKHISELELA